MRSYRNSKIEAVEQPDKKVFVFIIKEGDYEYQEKFFDWDAFLAWKAQFPGLK